MQRVLALCVLFLSVALVGCGSGEPTSVMESADQSAVEAYEAEMAAQDAAQMEDSGNE